MQQSTKNRARVWVIQFAVNYKKALISVQKKMKITLDNDKSQVEQMKSNLQCKCDCDEWLFGSVVEHLFFFCRSADRHHNEDTSKGRIFGQQFSA